MSRLLSKEKKKCKLKRKFLRDLLYRKKIQQKPRKPKISNESLVETKVREIVNRTKQNQSGSDGKKDSSTFSLDDVRAIIKNRSSEVKKAHRHHLRQAIQNLVMLSNQLLKKSVKGVRLKKFKRLLSMIF